MTQFKPVVYISAAISAGETMLNVRRAATLFKEILRAGAIPICPHWSVLQQLVDPLTYHEWIQYDLELIDASADCVLWDTRRCPGESPGARRETQFAIEKSLPVFYSLEECLEFYGLRR